MIEEQLLNWGVLGLWTLSLLYDKKVTMNKLTKVIEKLNTSINRIAREKNS